MQVQELYHQLRIPPNLQRHMLQVTTVGEYLCTHWAGETIDTQLIIQTLLLHDLGNIVKFTRPFLGELENNAAYWERVQDEFIQKYGTRATHATLKILQELGAREEIAELITDMSPLDNGKIPFKRLETRVCSFADMCVTPLGIEGFEARMKDLAKRYPTERVRVAIQHERANAKNVEKYTSIPVYELPRQQLEVRSTHFLAQEIKL